MTQECIFCKIVAGELSADIVYQDDTVTAFHDINPQAPIHVVVVPNRHIESLGTIDEDDWATLGHVLAKAPEVARRTGIAEGGFRVVLNTGRDAGMAVYHLHAHVLGGRQLGWPPG
jgi:histidine triad (HIT) family protein